MRFSAARVDLERTAQLRELYSIFCDVNPNTPKGVKCFATDHDSGYAYYPERHVTVPRFVFLWEEGAVWSPERSAWIPVPKRKGYVIYYLAHELAHIHNFDNIPLASLPAATRKTKEWDAHGQEFMQAFKLLCPEEYQHWEYEYKPESAMKADVCIDGAAS